MQRPRIILVAALARNRVIGRGGELPWRLPDDLKRFKALTLDGVVILGRKTHASIGRPLPRRRNLVVTRTPGYPAPGCETMPSLEAALDACAGVERVHVIGGGELYRLALPLADQLELTLVDADVPGDVTMPAWNPAEWRETFRQAHPVDERHALPFAFVTLERVPPRP